MISAPEKGSKSCIPSISLHGIFQNHAWGNAANAPRRGNSANAPRQGNAATTPAKCRQDMPLMDRPCTALYNQNRKQSKQEVTVMAYRPTISVYIDD